ncbi:hypothetical protein R1flu_005040 [Riccia fluitans]|uniref:GDSL esterase/lipase n=1 Tax=Riccia fluitans TaxID=41844 RepID=A0ABD1YSJ2_9MARC
MTANTRMAMGTLRLLAFCMGLFFVLSPARCDSTEFDTIIQGVTEGRTFTLGMFVFGDSVLDAGTNNYFPSLLKANFKPYGQTAFSKPTGRFTNGKTYADFFADNLRVKSPEPYLARTGTFSVNYASGGSGLLRTTNAANQVIPFPDQLLQFAQTRLTMIQTLNSEKLVQLVLSKSLFLINIGGNDLVTYFFDPSPGKPPLDVFIANLTGEIEKSVRVLYQAGGRKFMLLGLGPIGCIPAVLAGLQIPDGKCVEPANDVARVFNAALEELVLQKLPKMFKDIQAIVGRPFDILRPLADHGEAQGFTEGVKACCGYGLYNAEVQCGLAPDKILNPPYNVCKNVDAYLFWDYFHPTERVYSIGAQQFWNGGLDAVAPMNLRALMEL